ncbi:hypothetical protein LCGC14_0163940 [marine sediment metagenome]|uniref:Uncharacterized protein n=1 Tax=marine sediment metagenome TaxID=412755 RepID=A0A0F9UUI2_9ZZZZ
MPDSNELRDKIARALSETLEEDCTFYGANHISVRWDVAVPIIADALDEYAKGLRDNLDVAMTALKEIRRYSGGASPWAQGQADTAREALKAMQADKGEKA